MDLPPDAKIHPVVHVSQLKQHIPPSVESSSDLTTISTDPMEQLKPEKILDIRLIQRGASTITQHLVKWSLLPPELATWEEANDLQRRFPDTLS